jgi:hypothetical protein
MQRTILHQLAMIKKASVVLALMEAGREGVVVVVVVAASTARAVALAVLPPVIPVGQVMMLRQRVVKALTESIAALSTFEPLRHLRTVDLMRGVHRGTLRTMTASTTPKTMTMTGMLLTNEEKRTLKASMEVMLALTILTSNPSPTRVHMLLCCILVTTFPTNPAQQQQPLIQNRLDLQRLWLVPSFQAMSLVVTTREATSCA